MSPDRSIRVFDIVLTLTLLVVLSPLLVVVAALIFFTGDRRVFYRQERIGRGGHPFRIVKFATMLRDSPNMAGGLFTEKNDPRLLPFGAFLRRSKINELPQLCNVLTGDMSLVGYRPLVARAYTKLVEMGFGEAYQDVRPGITGPASVLFRDEERLLQTHGGNDKVAYYDAHVLPQKGQLDLWWAKNRSVSLYLKMLLATAYSVALPGKDAGRAFRIARQLPRTRFCVISTGPALSNERRVTDFASNRLRQIVDVSEVDGQISSSLSKAVAGLARQISAVATHDTVIVHSPLAFSVAPVLLGRLLRKQIIALVWDSYPVSIGGQRYNRSLLRRMIDVVERVALKAVIIKFVPTADFLDQPDLVRARVVAMWYPPTSPPSVPGNRTRSGKVRIVFAGQVNQTRGLAECLAHLDRICTDDLVEVTIFSRDRLPEVRFKNVALVQPGPLPPSDLAKLLPEFDLGLISLHPKFDQPGFPSKTVDYLSAGLPVIYYGKSLPSFRDLIESTGVGRDITNLNSLRPRDIRCTTDDIDAFRNKVTFCENEFLRSIDEASAERT